MWSCQCTSHVHQSLDDLSGKGHLPKTCWGTVVWQFSMQRLMEWKLSISRNLGKKWQKIWAKNCKLLFKKKKKKSKFQIGCKTHRGDCSTIVLFEKGWHNCSWMVQVLIHLAIRSTFNKKSVTLLKNVWIFKLAFSQRGGENQMQTELPLDWCTYVAAAVFIRAARKLSMKRKRRFCFCFTLKWHFESLRHSDKMYQYTENNKQKNTL